MYCVRRSVEKRRALYCNGFLGASQA